jgi:hypothetical protein
MPVAIGLAIVAVVGAFAGYQGTYGPMPRQDLGIGGFVAGAAAAAALLALRQLSRRALIVDTDGIELCVGRRAPTRIRWSEPHDFFFRTISAGATPQALTAVVIAPDGRRIEVDDAADPENEDVRAPRLADQYSTTANWPKIQNRLHDNETVAFGPVRLSRDKLAIGSRQIPMTGPVSLQVEQKFIRVGVQGEWVDSGVSVLDVANYPCLLRAIGQVTHARPPG